MRDRKLALVYLEVGQYESVKLNLVKNNTHQAWCHFKFFCHLQILLVLVVSEDGDGVGSSL